MNAPNHASAIPPASESGSLVKMRSDELTPSWADRLSASTVPLAQLKPHGELPVTKCFLLNGPSHLLAQLQRLLRFNFEATIDFTPSKLRSLVTFEIWSGVSERGDNRIIDT